MILLKKGRAAKMHHDFTWFEWMWSFVNPKNSHVFSGLLVALLLTIAAVVYKKSLKPVSQEVIPDHRVSLKNIFQMAVEALYSLVEGIVGPKARIYFPLIGTLFIYIFVNNLLGAIPGFVPATGNINTNLACSLVVFVTYNYLGMKEHGFKNYMAHFMGPLLWMAPLFFMIEMISHLVRPLTLAFRLFGNLTGDHIVLGIFSDLVPLGVPVIFMAFGIFVSFVQAFVFSLLSTVYIALAVAHEEH